MCAIRDLSIFPKSQEFEVELKFCAVSAGLGVLHSHLSKSVFCVK